MKKLSGIGTAAILAMSVAVSNASLTATSTIEPFRFRVPLSPATLDWGYAHTTGESNLLMNIMEGLAGVGDDLQPYPALAKRWQVSPDGLTYTFELRPGVNWSDGAALGAEDFVFAWKRLLSAEQKSPHASLLFEIKNAEAFYQGKTATWSDVGIKALNTSTLQVVLKRKVVFFPYFLSHWPTFPMRRKMLKHGQNTQLQASELITLGPYRLSKWDKGRKLVFERNPSYWGHAPAVKTVEAIIEPDDNAARELLKKGRIDLLTDVTKADVIDFSLSNPGLVRARKFKYLATTYLSFNFKSKETSALTLRQAVAMAIDKKNLAELLQHDDSPSEAFLPSGLLGSEIMSGFAFNPTAAREKLVVKPGPLTLVVRAGRGSETAPLIKDMLSRNLGLRISVETLDAKLFQEKVATPSAFDILVMRWGADYPDSSSFMGLFVTGDYHNYGGFSDSHYDNLIKNAIDAESQGERGEYYRIAQKILINEAVAIVPLYSPPIKVLMGHRTKDLFIDPMNIFHFSTIQFQN